MDKVSKLYDQSGYSDKYGLDLFIIITLAFIVFLACSYYLLRPYDEYDFELWWKRGRFSVLCMFISTMISGTSLSTLFWFICNFYMQETNPGNSYCDNFKTNDRVTIAVNFLGSLTIFIIIITL